MDSDLLKQKIASIKERMPLNGLRLDQEAYMQASFYTEVGEFAMELKNDARIAKDHLEFVKNKLKKDIRLDPVKFGISKLTNDVVEEICITHEDYQKALSDYSVAQYLADNSGVLLEAAGQRKSTLRDAVSLMLREYYMTSKDMIPEQKAMTKINEDEILQHRRSLAKTILTTNKEEETNEG